MTGDMHHIFFTAVIVLSAHAITDRAHLAVIDTPASSCKITWVTRLVNHDFTAKPIQPLCVFIKGQMGVF